MFKVKKQKLFGKTKTVDEAFEEQRDNFKKLDKIYHGFEKDLAKYDATIQAMSSSLTFLGNSFGTLYEGSPEEDGRKFKESADSISAGAKQYNAEQEKLRSELASYITKINDFKQRISERDNALVLGDAAADNLEAARKKEGHEFKINKLVEEAERTKEVYIELNTKLGQDLTDFYENRCDDFDEKLKKLVASQVALFKTITMAFQSIAEPDIGDGTTAARRHSGVVTDTAKAAQWHVDEASDDDDVAPVPLAAPGVPKKPSKAVSDAPPAMPSKPKRRVSASIQTAAQDDAPPPMPRKPKAAAPAGEKESSGWSNPFGKKKNKEEDESGPPSLPSKKNAVGAAAAQSMLKGEDPLDNEKVQRAAGNYVAEAALNEEMQDKAGKAVQGKARDKDAQMKAGAAIAASSDNKFVKVAANNRAIQSGVGATVGAAAGSKKLRQATGKAVASKARDPNAQKKTAGFLKKGLKR